jgi:hypothetical protein
VRTDFRLHLLEMFVAQEGNWNTDSSTMKFHVIVNSLRTKRVRPLSID